MSNKLEIFTKAELKKDLADVQPGHLVKVYQKLPVWLSSKGKGKDKDKDKKKKQRVQVFEGTVIARKHGQEPGATITVRRVVSDVAVEKIFPLLSPTIEKIEIIKQAKVRRAKLYYLRQAKGKRARLKYKTVKSRRDSNYHQFSGANLSHI